MAVTDGGFYATIRTTIRSTRPTDLYYPGGQYGLLFEVYLNIIPKKAPKINLLQGKTV